MSGEGFRFGEVFTRLDIDAANLFGPGYSHLCVFPTFPGLGNVQLSGRYIHAGFPDLYKEGGKFSPMRPIDKKTGIA